MTENVVRVLLRSTVPTMARTYGHKKKTKKKHWIPVLFLFFSQNRTMEARSRVPEKAPGAGATP